MGTYLYIKTHNVTGLKYFGKTIKADPYSYYGSGIYWLRHLKKHGYDFTTEILGYYDDIEECKSVALDFSEKYDIVNSKEWANLQEENVVNGFLEGNKYGKSNKGKKRLDMIGNKYAENGRGKPKSFEHRQKIGKAQLGKPRPWLIGNSYINHEPIVCIHCGTNCSPGNHARWHGNNCKALRHVN